MKKSLKEFKIHSNLIVYLYEHDLIIDCDTDFREKGKEITTSVSLPQIKVPFYFDYKKKGYYDKKLSDTNFVSSCRAIVWNLNDIKFIIAQPNGKIYFDNNEYHFKDIYYSNYYKDKYTFIYDFDNIETLKNILEYLYKDCKKEYSTDRYV